MGKEGKIQELPRDEVNNRVIGPQEVMQILKVMQGITYPDGKTPIHGWLNETDLDAPGGFRTPTGYLIKIEPHCSSEQRT